VFWDAAVRVFIAAVGPVAVSALTIERGDRRMVATASARMDAGWSMVYPSVTGTRRADAEQPIAGLDRQCASAPSGGVLIGYARCSTDRQDLSAPPCVALGSVRTVCSSITA
jgi:hypothetical protein